MQRILAARKKGQLLPMHVAPDTIPTPVSPIEFDWDLRFDNSATRLGLAYWRSCCRGRLMPRREDLDPVAMRKFTQHVGLVEARPGAGGGIDYFIRRAGTRWEDVYGPITGHYLSDFLSPELEDCWRMVLDAVRTRKAPVRITSKIDFQEKNWLSTEFLAAPLGADEAPSMVFITFVAWGDQQIRLPPKSELLHNA